MEVETEERNSCRFRWESKWFSFLGELSF